MAQRATARTMSGYIAAAPPQARKALRELLTLIKAAAPGVEEKISYAIPTFAVGSHSLIYMAGWKNHISIYPVTAGVARTLKDEIKPYRTGKGTLQFSLAKPIPKGLIRRIVKVRLEELR